MTDGVKHFLLTRFNVAAPGREEAIRLRPGWLDGRFNLFSEYCLPSVSAQTRQDFEWIVFFDDQTPEKYRRLIFELQGVYPFRAEFTAFFEMNKIVPQLVSAGEGAEWLLTTRLDSDDILAVDHMARLRDVVSLRRPRVINFSDGLILSIADAQPRLYSVRDDANPFASLMETMGRDVRTIWGEKHVDIERLAPIEQVGGAPAWMQIVHGANVSNRIKGRRVRLDSFCDVFPYLKHLSESVAESGAEIRRENSVILPMRQAKESLRRIAKTVYYAAMKS
ncbi:putative rhamnosyl transferase [Methylocella tundrae]|uniref:Putative rhamnosyl transferase n=1 Tax=Methylocella tundrae TaxID=227605 RepID=A0A8B6M914_METTU|nr:glycosyltransferase [Methylocella tundrae]VTZ25404.1 putative rhamnosyl transferase [Methylocella tundrae]VTZ51400.1 putative rhamnosyl transferase [Methylocella tundrae]